MGWVDTLHGSLVALDTAPLIYYVEANPTYLATVQPLFAALEAGLFQAMTSTIALTETLVHPLRSGDTNLAAIYRDLLLDTDGLATYPVTDVIANRAAELRAFYRLRTPDALHLATALVQGARFFITNDEDIAVPPEITVVVLQHVLTA